MIRFLSFSLAALIIFIHLSFAYAALTSWSVSKLVASAASAAGSAGVTVPALLKGTTSASNLKKWVPLVIPSTAAGKVIAAVAFTAGALAADYLQIKAAAWYLEKRIDKNNNQTTTVPVPVPYTPNDYKFDEPTSENGPPGFFNSVGMGIYADSAAAYAAAMAWGAENTYRMSSTLTIPWRGCKAHIIYPTLPDNRTLFFFYPSTSDPKVNHEVKNPLNPKQVADMATADMNVNAVKVKDLAQAALEATEAALANPANPISVNGKRMTEIKTALNSAVTTEQLTELETEGLIEIPEDQENVLTPAQIAAAVTAALANQGLSATQIAAEIAAAQSAAGGGLTKTELAETLASNGLTAEQIAAAVAAAAPAALTEAQTKAAVKEAIDDETGITPPVDPTISLPTKLSLTTVLNDFWMSVQAMPIFNVLNGITITTSGSSNLCIDLPAAYGGQRCYNAANVQDELNIIGNVILGLTTVISFIGVFKG